MKAKSDPFCIHIRYEDNKAIGVRFALMSFDDPTEGRTSIAIAGIRMEALNDPELRAAFESLVERTALHIVKSVTGRTISITRVAEHEQN